MTMSVEELRELLKGTPRVVLVEGEKEKKTDQRVYDAWLKKLAGDDGLGRLPTVVAHGSKARVIRQLKVLRKEVDAEKVFGLVDRDEWDDEESAKRLKDTPGLLVNPNRHCLESYFCDPEVLTIALGQSGIVDNKGVVAALKTVIRNDLSKWVEHWSLWTTLERLKNRMSVAKYPGAFHKGITLPADKEIKTTLQEWAAMMNVDLIMKDYRKLRKFALRHDQKVQLSSCIYAKNVFQQVVLVELNKFKMDYKSDEWMPELAKWMVEVPADLRTVLEPLIL